MRTVHIGAGNARVVPPSPSVTSEITDLEGIQHRHLWTAVGIDRPYGNVEPDVIQSCHCGEVRRVTVPAKDDTHVHDPVLDPSYPPPGNYWCEGCGSWVSGPVT